jgi:hypothetical protein
LNPSEGYSLRRAPTTSASGQRTRTAGLGYISCGGTLTPDGLLLRNECTWAHAIRTLARLRGTGDGELLAPEEREALDGSRRPEGVVITLPR